MHHLPWKHHGNSGQETQVSALLTTEKCRMFATARQKYLVLVVGTKVSNQFSLFAFHAANIMQSPVSFYSTTARRHQLSKENITTSLKCVCDAENLEHCHNLMKKKSVIVTSFPAQHPMLLNHVGVIHEDSYLLALDGDLVLCAHQQAPFLPGRLPALVANLI